MADSLDIVVAHPSAERTPTFWLINQALELLNREGKSAELAYSHVVDLLKDHPDAFAEVLGALHSAGKSLSVNLLYTTKVASHLFAQTK